MCSAGLSKMLSARTSESLSAALTSLEISPHFIKGIVTAELLLGTWLISGFDPVTAVAVTALTLTVFSIGLLFLIRRGYRGTCGCFLFSERPVSRSDIDRNIALIVACVFAVWSPARNACIADALYLPEALVPVLGIATTALFIFAFALISQALRILAASKRL